jgi:hypothetical protein
MADPAKKLSYALDLAETRLKFQLNGIRHASAAHIVDEMKNLIDAKIALATASAAPEAPSREEQYRDALLDLASACSGEVEEVFRGEIGEAMGKARKVLSPDFLQDLG